MLWDRAFARRGRADPVRARQILVLAGFGTSDERAYLLTPDGQPLPAAPGSPEVVPVTITDNVTAPEPSTLALFILAGLVCAARRGSGPIREFISGASGHGATFHSGDGRTAR
jgi:hypothetical protein